MVQTTIWPFERGNHLLVTERFPGCLLQDITEAVKRFDQETENFIAEFRKDRERPKGDQRAEYDVQLVASDVYLFLKIDGKTVATHAFMDAPEAWLNFRRDFAHDRLGIALPDDILAL